MVHMIWSLILSIKCFEFRFLNFYFREFGQIKRQCYWVDFHRDWQKLAQKLHLTLILVHHMVRDHTYKNRSTCNNFWRFPQISIPTLQIKISDNDDHAFSHEKFWVEIFITADINFKNLINDLSPYQVHSFFVFPSINTCIILD